MSRKLLLIVLLVGIVICALRLELNYTFYNVIFASIVVYLVALTRINNKKANQQIKKQEELFTMVNNIAEHIGKIESDSVCEVNNQNIIATLTHDLKTPAVAQIRAIELLLKGNLGEINETQRSFLTDILSSCNNMLDMLVNMLWLYKFDNKRIAVNFSSFNINELIFDILNENKLVLNSKNHVFEQNNKTAKIHIVADKMHIKRIIFNLLINAVTHSCEKSKIKIETSVQNNNFIFKVINKGEYLDSEQLNCIFDKNKVFTQKSDGLSTGLGLYLSNSLLELNGGKILYSSNPNGENTFGFTIQLFPQKISEIDKTVLFP